MAKTYEEIIADIEKRGLKTTPSEQKGWIDVPEYGNESGGWIAENNLVVRPNGFASVMLPENKESGTVKESLPEEKVIAPKFAQNQRGQLSQEDYQSAYKNLELAKPKDVNWANETQPSELTQAVELELKRVGVDPTESQLIMKTINDHPEMSDYQKAKWVHKAIGDYIGRQEVVKAKPLNM